MSAEDQARILNAGYLEYIRLGATHMLTGYDHLLFLFGVMFFLTRFSEIIKFITAFTIGYGDVLPYTVFGRLAMCVVIIVAFVVLPPQLSELIEVANALRAPRRRKYRRRRATVAPAAAAPPRDRLGVAIDHRAAVDHRRGDHAFEGAAPGDEHGGGEGESAHVVESRSRSERHSGRRHSRAETL